MDLDFSLDELRRITIHFPQKRLQKIAGQFQSGTQDQVEDLPAMFGVIIKSGQGLGIKDLIKHEL
jgi:hypothetical protein